MTGIHQYDDIIDLPHPELKRHSRMPVSERAAQFKPFAALTGYNAVIEEAARYTDEEVFLDESEKARINKKLRIISRNEGKHPEIIITFFTPDPPKPGGSLQTVRDKVKKIDTYKNKLILMDGREIKFDSIIGIRFCAPPSRTEQDPDSP